MQGWSIREQKYLLYISTTAFVKWLIQIKGTAQPLPHPAKSSVLTQDPLITGGGFTKQHPSRGISGIHHLSTASKPATWARRRQGVLLLPNLDGLHSIHYNLFNKVASSQPLTRFLHLYKYGALKLSYKPNFLILWRLKWRSQTNSPACKHWLCRKRCWIDLVYPRNLLYQLPVCVLRIKSLLCVNFGLHPPH